MPQDSYSDNPKDETLVASPESQTPKPQGSELAAAISTSNSNAFTIHRDESLEPSVPKARDTHLNASEKDNIHPYVQTLSISNLESCVALENAIFPEQERCSREKVDKPPMRRIIGALL